MHYKWSIQFLIFLLGVCCLPLVVSANSSNKDIALVYATSNQEISDDIQVLQEMLEAYAKVDVYTIEDVNKHTLAPYSGLVLFSSYKMTIPEEALQAFNNFQGSAVVIGHNVTQLAPFASWREGGEVELREIDHHPLESPINWQSIIPRNKDEVLVTASSFTADYPFIVKVQQQWFYVGMLVQKKPMQYDWPKLLADLLQLPPSYNNPTYIVITDINVNTDVKKLKSIIKQFNKLGIPITLEVTPLYEDEKAVYYLHDNKPLLKYLQELQQKGNTTIVLSSSNENIENSIEYLALRDIYPTFMDGQSSNFSGILQKTERLYIAKREKQIIYPYTVGDIRKNDDDPFYFVRKSLRQLYKVPGAAIGIRYPAYIGSTAIQELVDLLATQGVVQWLDLGKTNQNVYTSNVSIEQTANKELSVRLSFSIRERFNKRFTEEPFEFAMWVLVSIVSLFVVVFFINTLRLRITLRKRLFEERKDNG